MCRPKFSRSLLFLFTAGLLLALAVSLSAETVVVPFTGGTAAASTLLPYSGPVWISVSGTGTIAATPPINDAFYIFTDAAGIEIPPVYPDPVGQPDSGILWMNGAAAQYSISGWTAPPAYNSGHQYAFLAGVSAGPISFGVGDAANPTDNTGSYTVWVAVPAEVDLTPQTLNLRSNGRWVTVFIELPVGLNPRNIVRSSIRLNGSVAPAARPWAIGDHDGDRIRDLMVKFSRSAVQSLLSPGEDTITLTGDLADGTSFLGTTTVRVINPGRGRR